MHGSDLSNNENLVATIEFMYNRGGNEEEQLMTEKEVKELANDIKEVIEELPGGYDNPMLTLQAMAAEGGVLETVVPDSEVLYNDEKGGERHEEKKSSNKDIVVPSFQEDVDVASEKLNGNGKTKKRVYVPDSLLIGDGILIFLASHNLHGQGPAFIHSHEFGHHIQFQVDVAFLGHPVTEAEDTRRVELMADAFGSYHLTHKDGGALSSNRVRDLNNIAFSVGDCDAASPWHHGTPHQRDCAATWGTNLARHTANKLLHPNMIRRKFDRDLQEILSLNETVCSGSVPSEKDVMTPNNNNVDFVTVFQSDVPSTSPSHQMLMMKSAPPTHTFKHVPTSVPINQRVASAVPVYPLQTASSAPLTHTHEHAPTSAPVDWKDTSPNKDILKISPTVHSTNTPTFSIIANKSTVNPVLSPSLLIAETSFMPTTHKFTSPQPPMIPVAEKSPMPTTHMTVPAPSPMILFAETSSMPTTNIPASSQFSVPPFAETTSLPTMSIPDPGSTNNESSNTGTKEMSPTAGSNISPTVSTRKEEDTPSASSMKPAASISHNYTTSLHILHGDVVEGYKPSDREISIPGSGNFPNTGEAGGKGGGQSSDSKENNVLAEYEIPQSLNSAGGIKMSSVIWPTFMTTCAQICWILLH